MFILCVYFCVSMCTLEMNLEGNKRRNYGGVKLEIKSLDFDIVLLLLAATPKHSQARKQIASETLLKGKSLL